MRTESSSLLVVAVLAAVAVVAAGSASDEAVPRRPRLGLFPKGSKTFELFGDYRGAEEDGGRVAGGQDAEKGMFPYQAGLFRPANAAFFCGASIISERWIMTAAHCVDGNHIYIEVRVGILNISETVTEDQTFLTTEDDRTIHPQYSYQFVDNDIALIKLPKSLTFNDVIQKVALPTYSDAGVSLVGETLVLSGWGVKYDELQQLSEVLQYADLKVTENAVCDKVYENHILIGTKLCTTTDNGHSSCSGDSGGPLVLKRDGKATTVVGIVSFGHRIGCQLGYPVVFTRVANFLGFIEETTGIPVQDD